MQSIFILFLFIDEIPKVCYRPNEMYSCGSPCQNECFALGEPCPIKKIRCIDDCYCIKGYARLASGKCVPENECPPK